MFYEKNLIQKGSHLKALRVKNELQQKDLATMLSVDISTISLYESGKRPINVGILIALAQIFKMPLEELVKELYGKNCLETKKEVTYGVQKTHKTTLHTRICVCR